VNKYAPGVRSKAAEERAIRGNTAGFACPNQQCQYFGITEAHIHALVGDGKHGQTEQIQTFRSPACCTTFSARRNTPLYRLKTPSQQVAVVLSVAFRRAGPFRGRTGLRLSTSHDYHLAVPCWRARAHPAWALLLSSPSPAPANGRATHQAALRQPGGMALAGHRPLYEDSSRPPSGPLHAKRCA
jgi:hypothetical protein